MPFHIQVGSVLFCLAISHKQMALYYAPAFFAHLLGKCLQERTKLGKVGVHGHDLFVHNRLCTHFD